MSETYGEPQSRNEAILQNILGEHNELVYPQSRNEAILQAILYNTAYTEEARSRIETLLLCILNGTTTDMQPLSRNEEILIAKINGGTYDKEPQSRIELLLIDWLNAYEEKTVSGSIVSITDAIAGPVIRCECEVNAKQASGTPTPENPLLISGFTGLNITRAGKNLLGGSLLLANAQAYLPSGTTDLTAKTFSFSSTASADGDWFTGLLTDKFKENTKYTIIVTLSNSSATPSSNMRVYYTDGTYSAITSPSAQNTKETIVFDTNASKTISKITKFNGAGTTTIYYDECGVFEGTLSASQFEAYNATVYPITWQTEAGTVYGCLLNPVTGVLTVKWVDFYFDGSKNVAAIGQSSGIYYTTVTRSLNGINSTAQEPHIKSDKFLGALGVVEGQCYVTYNGTYLVAVLPQTVTTIQDATEWFQNNPTHFVYELATPQTYQLQAVDIELKQGINTVYHDGNGDITLTYKGG